MDILQAIDTLEKISFLDWKFKIEPVSGFQNVDISIIHNVPNTKTPQRERIKLTFTRNIDIRRLDEVEFVREVYNCILKRLRHESAELFKVNDEHPFDEHELNSIFRDPYLSERGEPETRAKIKGAICINQMMNTNFCENCNIDYQKHNYRQLECPCGRRFEVNDNGRIEAETKERETNKLW